MPLNYNKVDELCYLISRNIKKYRLQKGLTQKQLAIKTGYSYAYIRRLESKACTKNFSIKTIYNISKTLNIDIKKLFEDNAYNKL